MHRHRHRFVIWGYGSENLLGRLDETLRARGHEVLHLPDAGTNQSGELEKLVQAPYILLTSAHFGRDKRMLRDYYPEVHVENEFLDLLHHCPPALSVFYPHDLATPLVINEPLLLDAFDLVLWPTAFFGYQPRPRKVVEVGWMGFRETPRLMAARRYDSALLFSDICHHLRHLGVAGTFEKLRPILETGTAIKFPNWPGHEALEDHFRRHGANVIDAATPAGHVIQDSRLIVSNSTSSISVESTYMGTPVINLLEDYLPKGLQKSFLAGLQGCRLSTYDEFAEHMAAPPAPPRPCLQPFDEEKMLEVILSELDNRPPPARARHTRIEIVSRKDETATCPPPAPPFTDCTPSPQAEQIDAATPAHSVAHDDRQSDEEVELATAERLLELDQVEAAFSILQTMVSAGTTLAGPYHQIAHLALRQHETGIAEELLTLACARETPAGTAHLDLANLYASTQRFEDTLRVLGPLLRLGPIQQPEAYALLRQTLGTMPKVDIIPWARLLTDLRWRNQ